MKYKNIVKGKFIDRPNRFIANCLIDDKIEKVHVKNTGRCRELLKDNADVYLEYIDSKDRKTKYDLISVYKNDVLFNMDSQMPNKVFKEGVLNKVITLDEMGEVTFIKGEQKYKNSRFDFYVESENKKGYVEVKGVTLEEDGVAMFPDAPTTRGIKHVYELIEAKKEGYEAYICFIIQFAGAKYFTPNPVHKDFIKALKQARDNGVNVLCFECSVTKDEIEAKNKIPFVLK